MRCSVTFKWQPNLAKMAQTHLDSHLKCSEVITETFSLAYSSRTLFLYTWDRPCFGRLESVVISEGVNKNKKQGPMDSLVQAKCFSQRPFIEYRKTYLTLFDISCWKIKRLFFNLYLTWIPMKYRLEKISMHLSLIVSFHLPRQTNQACKIFDPAGNTDKKLA